MSKVAVLVPAFNENLSIQDTVRACKSISTVDNVTVIDDGSTDDTANLATYAGAHVIRLKDNLGKGGALRFGLEQVDADIYVFADADLGQSAQHLESLIEPVLYGQADMSIAAFPPAKKKGGFGLVKGLAKLGVRVLGGMDTITPLSGQRAIRKEVLGAVGGLEKGWGVEVALTIDALRKGFRVKEISLPMLHDETGRDLAGFRHRGRQFIQIFFTLFKRLTMRGA